MMSAEQTGAPFMHLINDANLIINLVPDIEFVNEGKNNLLAQAYFVRAWAILR